MTQISPREPQTSIFFLSLNISILFSLYISLFLYISIYHSLYLFICISTSLSIDLAPMSLSPSLSQCLFIVSLPIPLPVSLYSLSPSVSLQSLSPSLPQCLFTPSLSLSVSLYLVSLYTQYMFTPQEHTHSKVITLIDTD